MSDTNAEHGEDQSGQSTMGAGPEGYGKLEGASEKESVEPYVEAGLADRERVDVMKQVAAATGAHVEVMDPATESSAQSTMNFLAQRANHEAQTAGHPEPYGSTLDVAKEAQRAWKNRDTIVPVLVEAPDAKAFQDAVDTEMRRRAEVKRPAA